MCSPRVDFLGGGGTGASGSAIVNVLGRVIGVAIAWSLELDIQNHLYFHSLIVVIMVMVLVDMLKLKMVQFQDVVITSGGQEYLPNTTETTLNPDGSLTERKLFQIQMQTMMEKYLMLHH